MTFVPFAQNTREEVRIIGDGSVTGAIGSETGTHQQTFVASFDERNITSKGNRSRVQPGEPCHTLHESPPSIAFSERTRQGSSMIELEDSEVMPAVRTGVQRQQGVFTPWGVRRLTPTEAERLQGFPDNWTAGQPDSTRYRQLGNAVSVPVAEWIAKRIIKATAKE